MKHELMKVADIPMEGSKVISFFGREVHVYLAQGSPRAVVNACLHIGGPLECREGKFVCQWHQASFNMTTGERMAGPAPRGSKLMSLPTRVEGDTLFYVWSE